MTTRLTAYSILDVQPRANSTVARGRPVQNDPITYNPMTPGYFADPYPHYAQLREHNPAHVTKFGFLMLSSHQNVLEAYDNPLLSRDTRLWDGFTQWRRGSGDGMLERMMANWLVMIDPPR